MKTIATILIALIPIISHASGITNGEYELTFWMSNDNGLQQNITITNLSWTHNLTAMYFDVIVDKNGSLKKFDGDNQIVRGLVYEGKFKFIIPYANVVDVTPYIFEGYNTDTNGLFE